MFDHDQFEERAAIMEFDGGLSRFRAETQAAKAQGVSRHEAIRIRNSQQTWDQRPAAEWHTADHLPEVQRDQKEKTRSLPVGHVSAGWCGLALLALSVFGRGMV